MLTTNKAHDGPTFNQFILLKLEPYTGRLNKCFDSNRFLLLRSNFFPLELVYHWISNELIAPSDRIVDAFKVAVVRYEYKER